MFREVFRKKRVFQGIFCVLGLFSPGLLDLRVASRKTLHVGASGAPGHAQKLSVETNTPLSELLSPGKLPQRRTTWTALDREAGWTTPALAASRAAPSLRPCGARSRRSTTCAAKLIRWTSSRRHRPSRALAGHPSPTRAAVSSTACATSRRRPQNASRRPARLHPSYRRLHG